MDDMTVWKFPIGDPDQTTIKGMPLHIGLDLGTRQPAVWCLCDPGSDEQPRQLPYVVVMTGGKVPANAGQYVTTVHGIEGWIVAHFFMRKEAQP